MQTHDKRKLVLLEAFYRKVKVFKELYGSETPSVRKRQLTVVVSSNAFFAPFFKTFSFIPLGASFSQFFVRILPTLPYTIYRLYKNKIRPSFLLLNSVILKFSFQNIHDFSPLRTIPPNNAVIKTIQTSVCLFLVTSYHLPLCRNKNIFPSVHQVDMPTGRL